MVMSVSGDRGWELQAGSTEVRVFVSSTFLDLQAERDWLAKRVFPELRELCEQRGVVFTEIDLRWGVTDEQKADGHVLPVCLDAIASCRPFFIGILGERYGTLRGSLDDALLAREPWLEGYRDNRSVTELEFLAGFLNTPEAAENAYCYFRAPGAEFDQMAVAEPAESRAQLDDLKRRVRESGRPVAEFHTPEQLGELITADLRAAIERSHPEWELPADVDGEAVLHAQFVRERAAGHVGRRQALESLDHYAREGGRPVVVTGESGIGKSALLAAWVDQRDRLDENEVGLYHSIGASPGSGSLEAMLRRLISELDRRLDLQIELPDRPDALAAVFASALDRAAARTRVVVVIDGLDQLDGEGDLELRWLPSNPPANARLVVSATAGRPLDLLRTRDWSEHLVPELDPGERRALIERSLGSQHRRFSSRLQEQIISALQTGNPLFLGVLLEELRAAATHDTLPGLINHYLEAHDPADLYERVLERWEHDYDRDRPGLVRDALTSLWAARRGLTESELRQLLGHEGRELPAAHWQPLRWAARTSFTNRNGLIGFTHDYLRSAVQARYLSADADQHGAHQHLADQFASNPSSSRAIDELAWQLQRAHNWPALHALLANLAWLHHKRSTWSGLTEILAAWAALQHHTAHTPAATYPSSLVTIYDAHPEDAMIFAASLSLIISELGYPAHSLKLWEDLSIQYQKVNQRDGLATALNNRGVAHSKRGEYEQAIALFGEAEPIQREIGNRDGLASILINRGNIHAKRGEYGQAIALYSEAEPILRELGDRHGFATAMSNRGVAHSERGEYEQAIALLGEAESIRREIGDRRGLAHSLHSRGHICHLRGELERAMLLFEEAASIRREIGDRNGLANVLNSLGDIYSRRGEYGQAIALYGEAEHILREIGDRHGLAIILGNRALLHSRRREYEEAISFCEESEAIWQEIGHWKNLAAAQKFRTDLRCRRGRIAGRLLALKRRCRRFGSSATVPGSGKR